MSIPGPPRGAQNNSPKFLTLEPCHLPCSLDAATPYEASLLFVPVTHYPTTSHSPSEPIRRAELSNLGPREKTTPTIALYQNATSAVTVDTTAASRGHVEGS